MPKPIEVGFIITRAFKGHASSHVSCLINMLYLPPVDVIFSIIMREKIP